MFYLKCFGCYINPVNCYYLMHLKSKVSQLCEQSALLLLCSSNLLLPFYFSISLIPSSSPPSSRVLLLLSGESCRLGSGGNHLSACTSNRIPQRPSGLNCKLKTHYRAINPAIMLSNDLISLSVSPVSHQGPAVSSAAPRLKVPPGRLRVGGGAAAAVSGPSQPAVIKNRIEASIFRKCVKAK